MLNSKKKRPANVPRLANSCIKDKAAGLASNIFFMLSPYINIYEHLDVPKNMKVVSFSDIDKTQFFDFCKQEYLTSKDTARVNLWDDEWWNKPNTLPYLLENTDTYKSANGNFYILLDGDTIAGCAGVYRSKSISFAGSRTWISKPYRNISATREYLLPAHKKWSIENGCKAIALCFNEYNKNMITAIKRARLGENKDRPKVREPHHMFYSGIHEVGFPVIIRGVKQWVVYEKLDPNFEFSQGTWERIAFKGIS